MKSISRHMFWMGIGFVVLLILAGLVGVNALLLIPFFCLFMIVMMMAMMGHDDHNA